MKNIARIFGDPNQTIVNNISALVDEFRGRDIVYNFWSESEFLEVAQKDMDRAGIQYWREILDRAHFASATSIIRTVNWVRAISHSFEDSNFLSFMSSVRALTEFSGDAVHSLNPVPLTIAENSSAISRMLRGGSTTFVTSTDLEDSLIHFTHARKLKKGDATAESHRAEQTHVYVKSLEPYAPKIYEMYMVLCGYAHPAAQSVGAHMRPLNENDWSLTVDPGKDLISSFIEEWRSQFSELPMLATNQALCTLKVLSVIDERRYGSRFMSKVDLSGIPLWLKCASHLDF
ncbi:hypothetical protein [Salipiger sp. PrR003]|uniref:hypothetical protein n=1 Tax=Salipiger sp. PrR003 TaxID=2706776 RepID=UPI0013DAE5A2|nr:hypothetical protein [Salipiger sp. PrR003]NDV51357.1 hypothetical protein [Salipiger sp. PrR003]